LSANPTRRPASANRTLPLRPERYPLKVRILARYADVRPLWHINNVAIAAVLRGGAGVSTTMMVMGGRRVVTPGGRAHLIAHQSIDYLREATYPGSLEIGIGVLAHRPLLVPLRHGHVSRTGPA